MSMKGTSGSVHQIHSTAWKEECSLITRLMTRCKGEKLTAVSNSGESPERQERGDGRKDTCTAVRHGVRVIRSRIQWSRTR